IPVTKWWNIQNNLSLFHNKYRGEYIVNEQVYNLDMDQLTTNIYMMHNIKLPHNFSAEASGWYRSPQIWGTMRMNSQYSINAGVQYSFWDSNASLKLSAVDIFQTNRFRGESIVGENAIKIDNRWESRRVNLSFNYRFGNKEIKPVGRKRGASSDEQGRIKGSGS
ncbi:MAG: outer membrane beta-barrel family protein, partial [Bacteroidetes bacterium]|nr:outer membrane beta-barrel family protein [Bacteroidota bacterium]